MRDEDFIDNIRAAASDLKAFDLQTLRMSTLRSVLTAGMAYGKQNLLLAR